MHFWSQAPLVRLLLPLVAGIIASVYSGWRSPWIFAVPAALFVALILVTITRLPFRYRKIQGALIFAAIFFSGFALTNLKTGIYRSDHFINSIHKETTALVRLVSPQLEKERTIRFTAEVLAVQNKHGSVNTSGQVMLYFPKDSAGRLLRYGDELFIKAAFNEVKPPQNPYEFDYSRYLSFHNIWHQAFVRQGSWKLKSSGHGNVVLDWAIRLRDRLLVVMQKYGVQGEEYAVGGALLLGYEDKLDQDIVNAYSSTGALHVLSVSGLHVGIIYMVFSWLLKFLERRKHGKIIKAMVLLLLLWFYAALTGLSPSVLRSATMFSFIIAGKATNRYSNIYNVLAASAFLLLLINPYLIMQVGFQLSYLAVVGIVYLQPRIYEIWQPHNWLLDKIWAITAVSIAAQIATFPLGLHYFHQFPNYFLFSNLLVIPLSTLVIYVGIVLFLASGIEVIAVYVGQAFSGLLWLLNHSVKMFEYLPFAVLGGISITVAETWVIYGIIALILLYMSQRRLKYLRAGLVLLIILLSLQVMEGVNEARQKKLIVYNVKGLASIDLISGSENVMIADKALLENDSRMLFHVHHNWWELGLHNTVKQVWPGEDIRMKWLRRKKNVIAFGGQVIALINNDPGSKPEHAMEVDKLVLSHDAQVTIKEVLNIFRPALIIFDSSNTKRSLNRWKKQCDELGVRYYSVAEQGAYVEEI